ncbi:hypothetical protein Cni_G01219 [Canna indica]|uniref:Uncharacterized protein n=1 Tax=Canna indica TaxID=4628 RepID=A0AAQ3PYD0_9LILI|nr:hypothetical protein Cni_G01219 [Canna indica]
MGDKGKMRLGDRNPPTKPITVTLFVIVAAGSLAASAVCAATAVERDDQSKCDCYPCGCVKSSPPPPPPSPPPPPKWPKPYYCPPPPAPYLYIVATPTGNLYPYDPEFNPSSARRFDAGPAAPIFLLSALLGLLNM